MAAARTTAAAAVYRWVWVFVSFFPGLRITNNRGSICMKTRRTHGAIVWVCGDRKCTLRTTTVTHMLENKIILVYSPNLTTNFKATNPKRENSGFVKKVVKFSIILLTGKKSWWFEIRSIVLGTLLYLAHQIQQPIPKQWCRIFTFLYYLFVIVIFVWNNLVK